MGSALVNYTFRNKFRHMVVTSIHFTSVVTAAWLTLSGCTGTPSSHTPAPNIQFAVSYPHLLTGPTPDYSFPSNTKLWTVLIYLNADNDLEEFGVEDLNEMETVGSTELVNIIVQIDRSPGFDTSNGDWTSARRYYVTKDQDFHEIGSTLIQDLDEVDMGDPEVLKEFVAWGKDKFPAKDYLLVLWNHGSGTIEAARATTLQQYPCYRAISFDDTSGSAITIPQLGTVLENVAPVTIVAFDASLMQMLEIAYEIKNSAGIMIGSEESPPGEGFPYDKWLDDLVADPAMEAEKIASIIVDETVNYVGARFSATQSAIRLDRIGDLAQTVDALALKLTAKASVLASECAAAREEAQHYAAFSTNSIYNSFKDLHDYARLIEENILDAEVVAVARQVQEAVRDTVTAEAHTGTGVSRSNGIALYVSEPGQVQSEYNKLKWAKETHWDEWLRGQIQ